MSDAAADAGPAATGTSRAPTSSANSIIAVARIRARGARVTVFMTPLGTDAPWHREQRYVSHVRFGSTLCGDWVCPPRCLPPARRMRMRMRMGDSLRARKKARSANAAGPLVKRGTT
ncbi:hypothetical protein GCM10027029_29660 [Conyzicola lurida]